MIRGESLQGRRFEANKQNQQTCMSASLRIDARKCKANKTLPIFDESRSYEPCSNGSEEVVQLMKSSLGRRYLRQPPFNVPIARMWALHLFSSSDSNLLVVDLKVNPFIFTMDTLGQKSTPGQESAAPKP